MFLGDSTAYLPSSRANKPCRFAHTTESAQATRQNVDDSSKAKKVSVSNTYELKLENNPINNIYFNFVDKNKTLKKFLWYCIILLFILLILWLAIPPLMGWLKKANFRIAKTQTQHYID